jgi:hypothetical protein
MAISLCALAPCKPMTSAAAANRLPTKWLRIPIIASTSQSTDCRPVQARIGAQRAREPSGEDAEAMPAGSKANIGQQT